MYVGLIHMNLIFHIFLTYKSGAELDKIEVSVIVPSANIEAKIKLLKLFLLLTITV